MKYIYPLLLLIMGGCETSKVFNNAKPGVETGSESNIAIALDSATRTWIPWYFILVAVLTLISIKVWNYKK
tara:strand:+ start:237 stop:449 length:213 start_codon:yes stop_codon:yes gene_type:complete